MSDDSYQSLKQFIWILSRKLGAWSLGVFVYEELRDLFVQLIS